MGKANLLLLRAIFLLSTIVTASFAIRTGRWPLPAFIPLIVALLVLLWPRIWRNKTAFMVLVTTVVVMDIAILIGGLVSSQPTLDWRASLPPVLGSLIAVAVAWRARTKWPTW